MAPSEKILRLAWAWAGAKCACRAETHDHVDTCSRSLEWQSRGKAILGGWEYRHRILPADGGAEDAENCMIVCWPCYSRMRSDDLRARRLVKAGQPPGQAEALARARCG